MKKLFAFCTVATASLALIITICFFNQDIIIVYSGISTYRTLLTCLFIAVIVSICTTAGTATMYIRRKADYDDEDEEESLADLEKLCTNRLYSELKNKWKQISKTRRIFEQIEEIKQYRENLIDLTKDTSLGMNPAEIISKVERCMLLNVKKLLNYMKALNQKDKVFVQEKFNECVRINETLLQKARDFNIAAVDYLNKDMNTSDMQHSLKHVESYKQIVLETLDSGDIYLS